MRVCSACEENRHFACGMQTWCECECDPENCFYFPTDLHEIDEMENEAE